MLRNALYTKTLKLVMNYIHSKEGVKTLYKKLQSVSHTVLGYKISAKEHIGGHRSSEVLSARKKGDLVSVGPGQTQPKTKESSLLFQHRRSVATFPCVISRRETPFVMNCMDRTLWSYDAYEMNGCSPRL